MEASFLNLNTTFSISTPRTSQKNKSFQGISFPLTSVSFRARKKQVNKKRVCCVNVDRKLEAKVNLEEGNKWIAELEELREKWSDEKKGMVETLECLEKEAIMGEDEGKQPTDYQRRAEIFDKSSRVFQALKEHSKLNHS